MSLLREAKLSSLKDKHEAQAVQAEQVREKAEKTDLKVRKVVIKKSRKN